VSRAGGAVAAAGGYDSGQTEWRTSACSQVHIIDEKAMGRGSQRPPFSEP